MHRRIDVHDPKYNSNPSRTYDMVSAERHEARLRGDNATAIRLASEMAIIDRLDAPLHNPLGGNDLACYRREDERVRDAEVKAMKAERAAENRLAREEQKARAEVRRQEKRMLVEARKEEKALYGGTTPKQLAKAWANEDSVLGLLTLGKKASALYEKSGDTRFEQIAALARDLALG